MSTMPEMTAVPVPPADVTAPHRPKNKKHKTRRRVAKSLAWLALAMTAAMILAEPWLLVPAVTLVAALSLWD